MSPPASTSPATAASPAPANGPLKPAANGTNTDPPNADSARFHASSSADAMALEAAHAAHNYHPLPVVVSRAAGVYIWDPEGRRYLDFLSAYSAVNQGHCHPALVAALTEQAARVALSSRAFYNDVFPKFAEMVTAYFGYDMVLPMNTGAEAVETAVKVARKWAYKVKGVPPNEALVLSAADNFHGRTMTAISLSTDPESRDNYGPFTPNLGSTCPATQKMIPYNDLPALRAAFEAHADRLAAFLVEPIQGEAGIVVPAADYLPGVRALCDEFRVLLVVDEIQTGVARTGRMLCSERAGVRGDLVLLGKAISGGMYPVSCVLGGRAVLGVVEPGTHGSTYGGNPLGCAVAMRALEVVKEEGLVERAERLGVMMRKELEGMVGGLVKTVRGMGLLNAIVIDETKANGKGAWELCLLMKEKGLLVSGVCESSLGSIALTNNRPSRRIRTSSGWHRPWSSPRSRSNRRLTSSVARPRNSRGSRARKKRRWSLLERRT